MILSGKEILKHLDKEIVIDPFDETKMNPNSYNLSLHNELLVYDAPVLDMKTPNPATLIQIPPEGLTLAPGRLYLGRTKEFTKTEGFVPMLEGRSSIGRLGMCIHATAGFGDVGFVDIGDFRRTASGHLPGRRGVPDLLPHHRRGIRPVLQRQISEQQGDSAQPAVQRF